MVLLSKPIAAIALSTSPCSAASVTLVGGVLESKKAVLPEPHALGIAEGQEQAPVVPASFATGLHC